MNNLGRLLVESLLREIEENVTVLLPGGFKPPHSGHLDLALKYAALPNVSQVIVLVGPKQRDGITREQSIKVWNTLLNNNPKVSVQQAIYDNPLLTAYKFLETAQPGTYALAASSKGDDYTRVVDFTKKHAPGEKYHRDGINVIELPADVQPSTYGNRTDNLNGKGISASILRKDLLASDWNNFKTNYPNHPEQTVRKVYDILRGVLNESKLRVFDFDDTLVKTDSKVYVYKSDGRKIPLTPAQYAMYQPDEKDTFDHSDFRTVKSGKELKQYTKILKAVLQAPARARGEEVEKFLKTLGIDVPVVALANSDPAKKAEWIESEINKGVDDVYFLDDSPRNIQAVKSLAVKYPNVKIRTQNVVHPTPAQNYLRESNMLTEGGAAGHLAHPYEDYLLTFSDIKNMITAALSGQLDYAQEKLDGQNLMITYKDGKVRAARNKGQLRNFGQNSLTVNQLKQMFAGRGAIESAFTESMTDLEAAINKLDSKQKQEFFQNGKRFISLEILYPDTTNVVPYGASQIRMHHFKEYDENGNIVGEDVDGIYQLQKALNLVQAEEQKTFKIKTTDPAKLKKDVDFESQKTDFLQKVQAIQSKYNLSDDKTLGSYFESWWRDFIQKTAQSYGYKIPKNVLDLLIKRWAYTDKSTKIGDIKAQINNPEFVTWLDTFDKTQVEATKKVAAKPIETMFLQLGVRVLSNIENLTTINPDAAAKQMRQDVKDAIAQIKRAAATATIEDDDAALKFLKRELQRLKDVGGFKAILPTEGIVFKYNNKLFKLTGAFAPINQILGYLRF